MNDEGLKELGPDLEQQERENFYKQFGLDKLKNNSKIYKILKLLIDNPEGTSKENIMALLKFDKRCLVNLLYSIKHHRKLTLEYEGQQNEICKLKMQREHATKNIVGLTGQQGNIDFSPGPINNGKRKYASRLTGTNAEKLKQLLSEHPEGLTVKELIKRMNTSKSGVYSVIHNERYKGVKIKLEGEKYTIDSTQLVVPQAKPISLNAKFDKEIDSLPNIHSLINKLVDVPIPEQQDALHHLKHGIYNFKVVQAILDSNSIVRNIETELKKGWL